MRHDVVVVGGGPAGSVTALLLARAGHDVLLLERQAFPRPKPCGDCLSPGANAILIRLGLWPDVMRAAPALLRGWRLTAPGGVSFTVDFSDTQALAIRRDVLDAILLDSARAAGVRVEHHAHVQDLLRDATGMVTGVRARCQGAMHDFNARVVVGADGLRSAVARRLRAHSRRPRLRKVSFTVHTRLPLRQQYGEMRVLDGACLGVAPVDDGSTGTHNVTLVLPAGFFDARSGRGHVLQNGLRRFGMDVPVDDAGILTSGPFDWPVRSVTYDGAALVGDAAGYYDPFTGQGIYQAMAGAEQLAGFLDAALRAGAVSKASLAGYAQTHRKLRNAARRLQHVIEFVCARPALADFAFARCAQNQPAARELLAATGDLVPAGSLFSPRFLMRLLA